MPTPAEIDAACAFARYLARRMVRDRDDADDAWMEACLAVLRAAERFDPGRGVQWLTYAGDCAKGEILHSLRTRRTRTLRRRRQEGREVGPELLAPLPLDEPVWGEDGEPRRFVDLIPDSRPWPGQQPPGELPAEVVRAVAGLHPRLRDVLVLRFLEGISQKETGRRVGCSQMHVGRLEHSALKNVREELGLQEI